MPYKDPLVAKEKARERGQRYYQANKAVIDARNKAWAAANPEGRKRIVRTWWSKNYVYMLWKGAKDRAVLKAIPFSIAESDITLPEFCPVLDVALDYSVGRKGGSLKPNSPTLDRRVPALGYVPGNVLVISARANMIKSNATPEELRKVADYFWAMS